MKSVGIFVSVNLVAAMAAATAMAEVAPTPSTVSVSTRKSLGRVPPHPVGANAAVWDGNLLDSTLPDLLRDAGVRVLRYPGGSTADVYHWASNTTESGQSYANPNNTFDAFMGVVEAARARAMIIVNYGSGTPAEAADWVRYANRGGPDYDGSAPTFAGASSTGHRYHVEDWEIGNEIYGNGTYGASWEYDVNALGPSVYAERFLSYSAAMKAVDPSIKIGAVLTAPGNWPDGQTSATSPQPWDDTVLSAACDAIDFVDIHWYPQGPTGETDQALLDVPENGESTSVSSTPGIATMVATLRSEIAKYCGAHADDVDIRVTETNSVSYNPGKQTTSLVNALYLADSLTTWFENGVRNVDWWAIHNSPVCGTNDSASLYGTYGFGDFGFLSVGGTCSTLAEPVAETPFPAYYGFQMTSHFLEPGGAMLGVTSSTSLISAHAVEREGGDLGVMLVNKDPAASYAVTVAFDEFVPREWAEVLTFGPDSPPIGPSVVPVSHSSFTVPLGPYSLTTVRLPAKR